MTVIDRAIQLREIIENLSSSLPDSEAMEAVELFPRWDGFSKGYFIGDRVRYDGILYKCLQAHTSQETWTPTDAPSLWTRVLIPDPDVIPEWIQPDSTNPYMKGDKVTHNGKTWESLIDNNVWEPGTIGTESLWKEVTE